MVSPPKCTRRTRVPRRYSSNSCTIMRAPADIRGIEDAIGLFTKSYVSPTNVKCLLFLFESPSDHTFQPSGLEFTVWRLLLANASGPTGFGVCVINNIVFLVKG